MLKRKRRGCPIGKGMVPSKTKLGKFLRVHRLHLRLTQEQVAKLARMTMRNYQSHEAGVNKYLKPKQILSLAQALKCDLAQLQALGLKPEPEPESELGKFILQRRKELGLTDEQLAKRLKKGLVYVRNHEWRGTNINLRYLGKWAKALQCDLALLKPFVGFGGRRLKKSESQLGRFIRSKREECELTQAQLAGKLAISRQHMSQIELGQSSLIQSPQRLKGLAKILGLDLAKLGKLTFRKIRRVDKRQKNTLGAFLTNRRLELQWPQVKVAKLAKTWPPVISGIERNTYLPSKKTLDRIAEALKCVIPAELIPAPKPRSLYRCMRGKNTLGAFLTDRRLELKLSQAEVAKIARCHAITVSAVERNARRPRKDLLGRIAKALDCEIPAELIPIRPIREPRRAGSYKQSKTPLGAFLVSRRLKLNFTQQHMAQKAAVSMGHYCLLERGNSIPSLKVLIRLAVALKCKVGELAKLAGFGDITKIKALAGVDSNKEVVRKALELLRYLLEKQQNDYLVFLVKDKEVVELKPLL